MIPHPWKIRNGTVVMSDQPQKIEIQVRYPAEKWPGMDDAIRAAVGHSDYSGMGFGERDMGWYAKGEAEAARIEAGLRNLNLAPFRPVRP